MTFAEVVAQDAAKELVQRSLAADRLGHALLLRGPAGVGKLPLAWALAQRLLCVSATEAGDACGQCNACRKAGGLVHPDLHVLTPYLKGSSSKPVTADDAVVALRPALLEDPYLTLEAFGALQDGENKQLVVPIEAVRELRRRLQLKHGEGNRRVVIVWHIERMNPEAANALLKVLEEPPDGTHFIVTLEEPANLLPTIVSRCQTVRLGPVPRAAVAEWLVRVHGLDPPRANAAAALSEGSLPRALASLEGSLDGNLPPLAEAVQQWLRLCYSGKFADLQQWALEIGHQPRERQKGLLHYALTQLRDALAFCLGAPDLVASAEAERKFVENFAKTLTPQAIERMAAAVEAGLHHVTRNANAPLTLMDLSLQLHRAMRG